ncbi:hypothetical protein ACIG3E_08185 [Streptomyces sp. NPDC053474]|uniref:hypothetical protein n=1 Tax=Streptomyces sp. NPDC053474 TaxID=3365704 RepID=UPI0037D1C82C
MDCPVEDEEVRIGVDAKAVSPAGGSFRKSRSTGTFRIQHSYPARDGKPARTLWGDFKVDCLTTGGSTATVTGILVRTSPGHPWRTARGTARIGLSGATAKGEPKLTRCMAPGRRRRGRRRWVCPEGPGQELRGRPRPAVEPSTTPPRMRPMHAALGQLISSPSRA